MIIGGKFYMKLRYNLYYNEVILWGTLIRNTCKWPLSLPDKQSCSSIFIFPNGNTNVNLISKRTKLSTYTIPRCLYFMFFCSCEKTQVHHFTFMHIFQSRTKVVCILLSWKLKFYWDNSSQSFQTTFWMKIEFFRKIMVYVMKIDCKCTSKPLFDNKVTDQICIWKRWALRIPPSHNRRIG